MCIPTYIKLYLVLINDLLLMTGIGVITVGGIFMADSIWTLGGMAVAMGLLIFITSLFGIVVVFKLTPHWLITYLVLEAVSAVLEVVVCIFAFVSRGGIKERVKSTFQAHWNDTNAVIYKNFVENIQDTHGCCGVNGSTDWAPHVMEPNTFPMTCYDNLGSLQKESCPPLVAKMATALAAMMVTAVGIEAVAVYLLFFLKRKKKEYYD